MSEEAREIREARDVMQRAMDKAMGRIDDDTYESWKDNLSPMMRRLAKAGEVIGTLSRIENTSLEEFDPYAELLERGDD
jgi:hypothetical protein